MGFEPGARQGGLAISASLSSALLLCSLPELPPGALRRLPSYVGPMSSC